MKTDDLIKALGSDTAVKPPTVEAQLWFGLPLALGVSALLFAMTLGVRPDLGTVAGTWRFALKIVLAAGLAASALLLALRLARPAATSASARALVLAVPLMLAGAIAAELMSTPATAWLTRLIGKNWPYCLVSIPALSVAPLAALIWALRAGAPDNPSRIGAVAGVVASGIGAAIYATHCTDDSPLFVAVWYGIGVTLMAALGAALGSRLLRW